MMRFLLPTFIILFFSCSIFKKAPNGPATSLVVHEYSTVSSEAEAQLDTMVENTISKMPQTQSMSSQAKKFIKLTMKSAMLDEVKELDREIRIQSKGDTIWRYMANKTGAITEISSIVWKDRVVIYYSTEGALSPRWQNTLELKPDLFEIQKFPEDKKTISGYSCYKIVLRQKEDHTEEHSFPISIGDVIYEMYGTDKIHIPAYALLSLPVDIPNFFPLEVKTRLEKIPGFQSFYKLKKTK